MAHTCVLIGNAHWGKALPIANTHSRIHVLYLNILVTTDCQILILLIEFTTTMSCALGLRPHVTAITFLTVLLSLPDLNISFSLAFGLRSVPAAIHNIVHTQGAQHNKEHPRAHQQHCSDAATRVLVLVAVDGLVHVLLRVVALVTPSNLVFAEVGNAAAKRFFRVLLGAGVVLLDCCGGCWHCWHFLAGVVVGRVDSQ